jgi:broad specificity phosphatase PhoE
MTARIALIRHGPTDWNADKRLQGRVDRPLSDAGRAVVAGWRAPADLAGFRPHSSPLRRARETADALFGPGRAAVEPALIEMSFGDWDGERLSDLRDRLGEALAANEARGLDFQPPGGESPRAVQDRLRPLLTRWAVDARDRICVTHKGVIRAVYAWAVGWDMTGRPPRKLRWDAVHVFRLSAEGAPEVDRLDIPLTDGPAPG